MGDITATPPLTAVGGDYRYIFEAANWSMVISPRNTGISASKASWLNHSPETGKLPRRAWSLASMKYGSSEWNTSTSDSGTGEPVCRLSSRLIGSLLQPSL